MTGGEFPTNADEPMNIKRDLISIGWITLGLVGFVLVCLIWERISPG